MDENGNPIVKKKKKPEGETKKRDKKAASKLKSIDKTAQAMNVKVVINKKPIEEQATDGEE